MPVPEDIKKKAERRIALWRKNKGDGLTRAEIAEYSKLTRAVSAYVKKTWPETWSNYRALTARNRIKFKKAKPKPRPKFIFFDRYAALLQEIEQKYKA